jgi:Lar family restriction alleviation protein
MREGCMSDELKPCPFCGNKDIQRYNYVNEKFRVTCRDCRNTTKDWDGVDDAIEKWNTRVDPSPKWTYCEDALPERYDDYLITLANQSVCRAAYSTFSNDWMIPGIGWASDENPVIAWQPLPAPAEPKEAKW